ncbi:MAG: sulfatase [Phycisphaeraceae bacterium]
MHGTTRRDFVKYAAAGAAGLALSPLARLLQAAQSMPVSAPSSRPPNIVLILADDLGWKDVGYNGSDFYETPNIDRLAGQSTVFTAAYACAGNCAPSRACLLSGQYTPRHGVYAVGTTDRGPANLMRLVPIPNKMHLDPENVTVAEALKAAGYATGFFGKWHLGKGNGPTSPQEQGFDTARLAPKQGPQGDPKNIFSITRNACDFVEANKDQPFFAYVAHHAVHGPQEARKETLARFKAKSPGKQHANALYAACNYDLDDGVGILLRKLDELKLADNTLVVFTSDNGGTPKSSQEPLRGAKGCYYEGGIREPMIVRWLSRVEAGKSCATPVANVDFYPTFLAAAGATAPAGKVLDGQSILPLLEDKGKLGREAIFWHFPGYLDTAVPRGRDPIFRTRPVSVIRKGDWKLHLYHEEWVLDGGRAKIATNKAAELYNVVTDVGERNDLAASRPDKRDELLDDLLAWIKKTDAPLPSQPNKDYDPTKPPQPSRRGGGEE